MQASRWHGTVGGRIRRAATVGLMLAGLASPVRTQTAYHPAIDPELFPLPAVLVPNVEFWTAIFSEYTSAQTVIHDNRDVDVVFAVVDVSDLEAAGYSDVAVDRARRDRVRDSLERYQAVLRRLAGDTRAEASFADVERVRALYAGSARQATDYRAAVDRLRGQRGLRDTFAEAIATSGLFMTGIEAALARYDVPAEIRCLPFVESMFNYQARSRVGASGVWQFTAATGRRYLAIDAAVDERHDVWLAADAAARMLRDHHDLVGSWPLALTGYNHGISGMRRAQRQLGTSDIGVIAERYRSPTFGFASRNFYAEFLAAVIVFEDRASLFPGVSQRPEVRFDEVAPEHYVSLLDLAAVTGTDASDLVALNPALRDDVAAGRLLVPPTYPLRVPAGTRAEFTRALSRLPESRKRDRQLGTTYRVRRGDTLGAIARRFGTSVAALQRANGITRPDRLQIGQTLEVRTGGSWSPLVWTPDLDRPTIGPATAARVHVVQRGETVYQIARRYGLTVAAVAAANDLLTPDRILVGMTLTIPAE